LIYLPESHKIVVLPNSKGMLLTQTQRPSGCDKAVAIVAFTTMFAVGMITMTLYAGGGIH